MTKICHLTSVHSHTDTRIFLKECKTLADAGYDVNLVVQHETDEVLDGVKIWAIDKPKNRKERMIKTVNDVYKKALEIDVDIYHFHDPELIPVGLRLKKRGKKVIYDVHEDVPRQILSKGWIPAPFRKLVSWLVEHMENYAAKKFDYIVTATPFIRDRFLRNNKRTIDINNYPILSELHTPNSNWDSKEKVVCYVGGIGVVRGINEMVDAIGMTNYNLLLAGIFASESEREGVISKDGWGKVIELGHIDRNGVKKALARSMAGLITVHPIANYLDGLPTKMFEYMSAEIPVIASNFHLLKTIIDDNKCGVIVNPLNPEEIADAIKLFIENPVQAKIMGENGRKAVEEKYNWEREGEKLVTLYKELLP